jgi:ABC-type uncharacterized transport system ATPase component
MNIQNDGILNPVPGNPNGYVSRNLEWAAVPYGKKFVILHNGKQVHTANNYKTAKSYIQKALKGKSVSTLDEFI